MAATVWIIVPPAWRALLNDADPGSLRCQAATVRAALEWLIAAHPALAPRLLQDGRLPRWTNIFLGEENIRDLGGLGTTLRDGATLTVLPAMAGG
ncbi:MoaD/ThiS family protein [Actinomadura roseirufa]|uniref:MoaD/ThiS family protein n=1 Tax=Actinomadura roseirufa TaxID=2094049 RepID=UPI00104131B7|nr:MoaD/ThiS family protein [Actinomadura roseirufa]